MTKHHSNPVAGGSTQRRDDGATGENDKLSRRYVTNSARLKPNRAPHIVVYLSRFDLHVAPKLVAISAVKEIQVAKPEGYGTNN
jgi:hypothetical protein